MKTLAFIPARGGSKGIPRKNLKEICGKPLITWSIEAAKNAQLVETILVSTDDEEIAETARRAGAVVPFLRPGNLASDTASTEATMLHALAFEESEGRHYDAMLLLQPTSPLRMPGTIDAAITHFDTSSCDSLVSVCEDHGFTWKNLAQPTSSYDVFNRPRRQDILDQDRVYRETGSIYITDCRILKETGCRLGGRITMFEMDTIEQLEIDTEIDLMLVTRLMEHFLL
jgi:CMP-N,N'-diacetyllegionaminic acid synthase